MDVIPVEPTRKRRTASQRLLQPGFLNERKIVDRANKRAVQEQVFREGFPKKKHKSSNEQTLATPENVIDVLAPKILPELVGERLTQSIPARRIYSQDLATGEGVCDHTVLRLEDILSENGSSQPDVAASGRMDLCKILNNPSEKREEKERIENPHAMADQKKQCETATSGDRDVWDPRVAKALDNLKPTIPADGMEIRSLWKWRTNIEQRKGIKEFSDNMSKKDIKIWGSYTEYEKRFTEGTWINCDIRYLNFKALGKFDIVYVDPPWRVRGAEGRENKSLFGNADFNFEYNTLMPSEILDMGIQHLSDCGFIFLWTINSQLSLAFECLNRWGYTYVDRLVWIKKTCNEKIHISQGYYFLHSSEICLVGAKGRDVKDDSNRLQFIHKVSSDVIFAQVREKSRKPEVMYLIMDSIMPGSRKLELFARNHNLRPGWLSIGNQIGEYYDWDKDLITCDNCEKEILPGRWRFKRRIGRTEDLCHPCFTSLGCNIEDYFHMENRESELVFHDFFQWLYCDDGFDFCEADFGIYSDDKCDCRSSPRFDAGDKCKCSPVPGVRFSCENCDSFDLCEGCYDKGDMLQGRPHREVHQFCAVEVPRPAGGLPLHKVTCSACNTFPIIGHCVQCLECPAYLCHKCFFLKKEPKNHTVNHEVYIHTDPEEGVHQYVKCDGCNQNPIVGHRFKCLQCYNYDLCEKCHERKNPPRFRHLSHRSTHTFTRVSPVDKYEEGVDKSPSPPKLQEQI